MIYKTQHPPSWKVGWKHRGYPSLLYNL